MATRRRVEAQNPQLNFTVGPRLSLSSTCLDGEAAQAGVQVSAPASGLKDVAIVADVPEVSRITQKANAMANILALRLTGGGQ
jgi:hypothetical protein